MQVINRYVTKQILSSFLLIIFVFMIIASFVQALSQLKFLGRGGYDFIQLLLYVVLQAPRNFYTLLPMICVVSVAFALGRMALRQELVAISAVGIGIFDMIRMVCKIFLQIVVVGMLIGEGIAPYLSEIAVQQKIRSFYNGNALVVRGGLWLHENNWYINIGKIIDNNRLADVARYYINSNGTVARVEFAKSAVYQNDDWVLSQVQWTEIAKDNTTSGYDEQLAWNTVLDDNLLENAKVDPKKQSLFELFYRIINGAEIGIEVESASYVFWQRIFQPIVLFLMLLMVVVVFFISAGRNKYGKNIIMSVMLGITFYTVKEYLCSLLLYYNVPILLTAMAPVILGVLLLIFLLQRYLQDNILVRLKESR